MRWGQFAFAGLLALAFAQGASAQTPGLSAAAPSVDPAAFKSAFNGIDPAKVSFRKVDVNNVANAGQVASSIRPPSAISTFFRAINPFSLTPIRATGNMPQPMYRDAFTPVQPTTMTLQR